MHSSVSLESTFSFIPKRNRCLDACFGCHNLLVLMCGELLFFLIFPGEAFEEWLWVTLPFELLLPNKSMHTSLLAFIDSNGVLYSPDLKWEASGVTPVVLMFAELGFLLRDEKSLPRVGLFVLFTRVSPLLVSQLLPGLSLSSINFVNGFIHLKGPFMPSIWLLFDHECQTSRSSEYSELRSTAGERFVLNFCHSFSMFWILASRAHSVRFD